MPYRLSWDDEPGRETLELHGLALARVFAATIFRPAPVIWNLFTLTVRSPARTVSTTAATKPSHTIPASIAVETPYAIIIPRLRQRALNWLISGARGAVHG